MEVIEEVREPSVWKASEANRITGGPARADEYNPDDLARRMDVFSSFKAAASPMNRAGKHKANGKFGSDTATYREPKRDGSVPKQLKVKWGQQEEDK